MKGQKISSSLSYNTVPDIRLTRLVKISSLIKLFLLFQEINTETQEVSVSFDQPINQTLSQLLRSVITHPTDALNELDPFPNYDEIESNELFSEVLESHPFNRLESVSLLLCMKYEIF